MKSLDAADIIKGGQGRNGAQLAGSAFCFGFCALLGALMFAGGCFAQWYTRRRPPAVNVAAPVVNIQPPRVSIRPPVVNIQPPRVNIAARVQTPERIVEKIKVAPVRIVVLRKPPPRGSASPASTFSSFKHIQDLDRYGEVLPKPKEK